MGATTARQLKGSGSIPPRQRRLDEWESASTRRWSAMAATRRDGGVQGGLPADDTAVYRGKVGPRAVLPSDDLTDCESQLLVSVLGG